MNPNQQTILTDIMNHYCQAQLNKITILNVLEQPFNAFKDLIKTDPQGEITTCENNLRNALELYKALTGEPLILTDI